jgi:hypothetical protein
MLSPVVGWLHEPLSSKFSFLQSNYIVQAVLYCYVFREKLGWASISDQLHQILQNSKQAAE